MTDWHFEWAPLCGRPVRAVIDRSPSLFQRIRLILLQGVFACGIGVIRVAFAPNDLGGQVLERLQANHTETKGLVSRAGERIGTTDSTLGESSTHLEALDRRVVNTEQKSVRRGGGGGGPVDDPFSGSGRSPGLEFATSEAVGELKDWSCRGTYLSETKSTITSGIGPAGGALGGLIPPDRGGVIPIACQLLTIRGPCSTGRTKSNVVTLMRQTTRANAATPEGTLKGESGMAWTEVAFKVATIATWIPVTRQVLDDAAGLQAIVDGELRANLGEVEENPLLSGNGSADNLMGVVPQAQPIVAPFVVANPTPFDRLLQAPAQASIANYKPSAIVLNTADAFQLHSIKDTAGRYIGGGPYEGLVNLLWSIPWVASNAMPQNEFVLGDFANAAQIWDRMDAEVLITDSHADFFVRNLYVIRAEQRLAFAIRAPQAFVTGQLKDA